MCVCVRVRACVCEHACACLCVCVLRGIAHNTYMMCVRTALTSAIHAYKMSANSNTRSFEINAHLFWLLRVCSTISLYSAEEGSRRSISHRRALYLESALLRVDQLVDSPTATMSLISCRGERGRGEGEEEQEEEEEKEEEGEERRKGEGKEGRGSHHH